jgi:quercetin dioxygenase-like cupin family protein
MGAASVLENCGYSRMRDASPDGMLAPDGPSPHRRIGSTSLVDARCAWPDERSGPMNDDPQRSGFAMTRRGVLYRLGGLATVLTAVSLGSRRAATQVAAQDASPTPAYATGVTAEILSRKEADAAPGYYLQVVRVTFAPDAIVAPHFHPGDTVTYQESGSHAFTVLDGEAHLLRAGSGTPEAGPAGEAMELDTEYDIAPGDALTFNAQTVHTARNPTGEPAVLLEAQLREMGMPLTHFLGTPVP